MGAPVEKSKQAEPRDGQSRPVLLVKLKKKTLARYTLEGFRTIVGRSGECDIVLDGSSRVSRNHAQVLVIDGEVVVEDLGSRNGLYVNRKPCKRRTLQPGDCIGIGQYRLHLLNCKLKAEAQSDSVREIARLFRLWRDAAVTSTADDSVVMLGLSGTTGEVETPVNTDSGDYPAVDDGWSPFDDDHQDSGSREIQAVDVPAMGGSTFVRPVGEQDEMMEKARRLVGQDAVDEAATPEPASEAGDEDTGQNDSGSLKRRRNWRRKLPRKR